LIGNGFGTFDHGGFDPKINRVYLLPMMDAWTKFGEWQGYQKNYVE